MELKTAMKLKKDLLRAHFDLGLALTVDDSAHRESWVTLLRVAKLLNWFAPVSFDTFEIALGL